MLRKSYHLSARKDLPVPPLCESVNDVVEVEIKDPTTGHSLGKHFDQISVVKELSEVSCVAQESADLYSIENMNSVGMTQVFCPTGSFIRSGLGSIERAEASAQTLLNNLPNVDPKTD